MDDIWDYSLKRWGLDQAELYIRELWQHIEAVVQKPALGWPCPEVRAGYYKYPSGSHLLFYRLLNGGGIEISRILHKRMDYSQHI